MEEAMALGGERERETRLRNGSEAWSGEVNLTVLNNERHLSS